MTKRVTTVGQGTIRERQVISYSPDDPSVFEGFQRFNEALAKHGHYGMRVERMRRAAEAIIAEKGVEGIKPYGWSDTIAGRADAFLKADLSVRRALEAGNADEAARFAVDAGIAAHELKMMVEFQDYMVAGRDRAEAAKDHSGNKRRNSEAELRRENWRMEAERIRSERVARGLPTLSVTAIARIIERKYGVSYNTIRKVI